MARQKLPDYVQNSNCSDCEDGTVEHSANARSYVSDGDLHVVVETVCSNGCVVEHEFIRTL